MSSGPGHCRTPVDSVQGARSIALTGYGQDEDLRRAAEAGFDQHLTKPADPTALEALIAAAG